MYIHRFIVFFSFANFQLFPQPSWCILWSISCLDIPCHYLQPRHLHYSDLHTHQTHQRTAESATRTNETIHCCSSYDQYHWSHVSLWPLLVVCSSHHHCPRSEIYFPNLIHCLNRFSRLLCFPFLLSVEQRSS